MPTQIDFTIKKDGSGDYTSIKSFVLAEMKDLVAADENLFVTIFGDGWDSVTPLSETFIDFNNFTTDATRNITFCVREEDRHDFTAGSGFVFTISASFGFVFRSKHIVLDGFEITNTSNTNNLFDTSTNAKMINCLVHDVDYAQFQGDGEKNIHYNYASRGGFTNTFYNGGTIRNITCIQLLTEGGFTGDIGIANANCTNVVLYTDKPTGSFTNFYNCTGDYNAANKAEGQPGANSFDTVLITDFVDFAGENYISKLGGQLDGSGESGGFIGAFLEESGGGELNIVGSTPSYSFAVPLANVDLTGELSIVGSTPSYSYTVPLANVDLTGELNVVGSTPSYSFAVPLADVDLTGELNIVGSTPSYSFAVPLANVDLTGELNVVGSTPSYSFAVPLADVDLTGELNIVGSTPSYSFAVPLANVDLTGELNVVGSTPSYSFAVPLANVDLTGELNIVGSTPSYSFAVPLANVDLTGDLSIVGTTPTYSYVALRGVVSFSGGACLEIKGDITLNSKQFSGHDHKAPVACFESTSGSVTIDSFNK